MNKPPFFLNLLSLFCLFLSAVHAQPPPELTALWDSVEALATDLSYSGRISKNPLVPFEEATDTTGKVKFVHQLVVERCRFKYATGDFIKASLGPGTVFRHNYFGYGWMFDPMIIPWTEHTGGVGIRTGDEVVYRNARSKAKIDYPKTTPPASRGDASSDEWENLGDIPHFDYIQDDDGGPILWEANLFEVGLMDSSNMELVNNIIRFARDFGNHTPIAGQRFVGNVFRLRENYKGPNFPVVINHVAREDQTLEEVNVFGHIEFSYNLLIPNRNRHHIMYLAGKAEENLIFVQNYLTSDRTLVTPPAKSITTTTSSIPTPPPTRKRVIPPAVLFEARMLWKDNGDGTRSYRTLPPIYEHRVDSVEIVAALDGVKLENHDDSLLHTHPVTSRFRVKYVLKNQAGTVESEAVPVRDVL